MQEQPRLCSFETLQSISEHHTLFSSTSHRNFLNAEITASALAPYFYYPITPSAQTPEFRNRTQTLRLRSLSTLAKLGSCSEVLCGPQTYSCPHSAGPTHLQETGSRLGTFRQGGIVESPLELGLVVIHVL